MRIAIRAAGSAYLITGLGILSGVMVWPGNGHAQVAHPDLATEALYSEALIAFSKQNLDAALQNLDQALRGDPNHLEALELKALILKTRNDNPGAIAAYQKLLQLRPEKDSAPYLFELGVLQHRQKNIPEAKAHFQKSIERGFNRGASHFFLGLMAYEASDLDTAETHFKTVSNDTEPELKSAGLFYLGLIQIRAGNGRQGADLLTQARGQAADRMLAPFDQGKFFANASFIPTYNSNVALTPAVGFVPTGTQSIQALASAGGGYITSPMKANQFVYSLRARTNINTAISALPYQFFSFSPAVNWNWQPLARSRFGAWFTIEHTLQYVKDATDTFSYSFDRSYATIPEIGVRFATELTPEIQLKAHALLSHADYKASGQSGNPYGYDPSFYTGGIYPRFQPRPWEYSGDLHQIRVSAQLENGFHWLNPTVWSRLDWYNAKGADARYGAFALGIGNTSRFGRRHTLNVSLEAAGNRYYETDRSDGNLLLQVNHVFQVAPHWSVIADASYTINTSSWGELSYNRYTGGIGVGWSL